MEIPENNGRTKKPTFVESVKRQIPENNGRTPIPKKITPGRAIPEKGRPPAFKNALKRRLTSHEQHVAHKQHMANVKNNPEKYG